MSKTTIARRYDVKNMPDSEREQLIQHLIAKTQPQRRIFLGKLDGFKDKEDEKINRKMLKAYLRGHQIFYHGTRSEEVINYRFNKETNKHDIPEPTGILRDVPQGHLVRQMYFYN